jgi:hypothetical protein
MRRTYSYSLDSKGNTKHIVNPDNQGVMLCGRFFNWTVWDGISKWSVDQFDLSKMKVCKTCERIANERERQGEKVGS